MLVDGTLTFSESFICVYVAAAVSLACSVFLAVSENSYWRETSFTKSDGSINGATSPPPWAVRELPTCEEAERPKGQKPKFSGLEACICLNFALFLDWQKSK